MLTQTLHKFSCPPTSPLLSWTILLLSALCPSPLHIQPAVSASWNWSSQFENHHLQIQEAGVEVEQKRSRLRKGNAIRMKKAGVTEQGGWSLKRPIDTCTPEDKVALAIAFTVAVTTENQTPQHHARFSWRLQLSHRWHMHTLEAASEHKTRPGWVFTPPVALILGNFRQISSSWYCLSEGEDNWLKEFKKSTNPKFT